MPLKFGTSGVRGLVTEMTDQACYLYARAFTRYLKEKSTAVGVALAGDTRSSTPRILRAAVRAVQDEGLATGFYGFIPTPALVHYALANQMGSIMVTGSHIPDDRNGLKFNMPWGEVLKQDEIEISRHVTELVESGEVGIGRQAELFDDRGMFRQGMAPRLGAEIPDALTAFEERYARYFPPECLEGMTVVVYQHSTVARDLLADLLKELGAEVVLVGRSARFIPVDTEAVDEPERLAEWVEAHGADALVTADGDGDRPLVVDDTGQVMRGDVLGILIARYLRAEAVITPVSCNTALEKTGWFPKVIRTKIGSPYVVEGMAEAMTAGFSPVVGYEANGGFLLASEVTDPASGATLSPLPTRDAALPILALLASAAQQGKRVSELAQELPSRFTASGLLREFPNETGKRLVDHFETIPGAAARVFGPRFGELFELDVTDGVRMTFASGDIVHIRPSGNAPEFRVYTEAGTEAAAWENNAAAMAIVEELKQSGP